MAEALCEVWFYHLERTALDHALPDLLEKTLARGWRAIVQVTTSDRLEQLDTWLWSYRDDSFLPHGLQGESQAERQPILLTTGDFGDHEAHVLFLIDGAEPARLQAFSRCVVMFDGRDEAALAQARALWKSLTAQDLPLTYWRQNERGGWEKQG